MCDGIDNQGRQYAKIVNVKPGARVVVDSDFTCMAAGAVKEVKADADGDLYIDCDEGSHHLDGQIDGDFYIGLYPEGTVFP